MRTRYNLLSVLFCCIIIASIWLSPVTLNSSFKGESSTNPQNTSVILSSKPELIQYRVLWFLTYGEGSEHSNAIIQCSDGGFAITGKSYKGPEGAYLLRIDRHGQILWEQRYYNWTRSNDIVQCSDGGFAMVGFSAFGDQPAGLYVLRVGANGQLLWNHSYCPPGLYSGNEGFAIVACSDGGFAICGYIYDDVWLLRLEADGMLRWNQTFGGEQYEEGRDLVACGDGGFAILGGLTHLGDVWLIRTDNAGNPLWNTTYGGAEIVSGSALVECSNGDLAIAARNHDTGQNLIIRVDSEGRHLWNCTYGPPENSLTKFYHFNDLVESREGGFAVGGSISGDLWFLRLDESGETLCNFQFGGYYGWGFAFIEECQDSGFIIAAGTGTNETHYIGVVRLEPVTPSSPLLLVVPWTLMLIAVTVFLITFLVHRSKSRRHGLHS